MEIGQFSKKFKHKSPDKITEGANKMNLLMKYIIALSNLYGMVPKEKVLEIYNSQNDDPINLDDVEDMYNNCAQELEDHFIEVYRDYFVHEAVLEFDEFEELLRKKADKPYYIPRKNQLLKYFDETYFEKTEQYKALLRYVKRHFFKGEEEYAEWLCEDIEGNCHAGADIQQLFPEFTKRGIHFEDMEQLNEVSQLIMDLSNNVRIWENNGHTPREIFEKFEKPNLMPLSDHSFDYEPSNVISMKSRQKIGRNDPCPCGSGKKFKKCCM